MTVSLQERFRGCLLGLAAGDALGGRFEAQDPEFIRGRFDSADALLAYVKDELWYTDDTQMTIGVASALIDDGEIVESRLCQAFVQNYVPSRGYGRGARAVIEAMEDNADYQAVAQRHFPGGSYGNGAAMRVAPVGLMFRHDPQRVLIQAERSALPTHQHPLGIEGAQLLALAVASVSRGEFDKDTFINDLLQHCRSEAFRLKLQAAAEVSDTASLAGLGNGIAALESVPTAIACFMLSPDSYFTTIANAIFLGGDTDTIAAMAGAISGAHLGLSAIPEKLIQHLESSPQGRDYLMELADQLLAASAD